MPPRPRLTYDGYAYGPGASRSHCAYGYAHGLGHASWSHHAHGYARTTWVLAYGSGRASRPCHACGYT